MEKIKLTHDNIDKYFYLDALNEVLHKEIELQDLYIIFRDDLVEVVDSLGAKVTLLSDDTDEDDYDTNERLAQILLRHYF